MRFTKSEFFRLKIHPLLVKIPLYDYFLLRKKSYLRTTGWFRSFREGASIDKQGNPLPWFTYSAIEFLKDRIPNDVVIFEYGSGMGTLWWAMYASRLDVVEDNQLWINKIEIQLPVNVNLIYRQSDDGYVSVIRDTKRKYDIIVVDGKNRYECCKESVLCLNSHGIIVLDDTDRPKQHKAVNFLKENGFRQLSFRGFSPIEFIECETSVFYREGNLLGI